MSVFSGHIVLGTTVTIWMNAWYIFASRCFIITVFFPRYTFHHKSNAFQNSRNIVSRFSLFSDIKLTIYIH